MLLTRAFLFCFCVAVAHAACPWSRAVWDQIEPTGCCGYEFVHPDNCVPSCSTADFPHFCARDLRTGALTCEKTLPGACCEVLWPNANYNYCTKTFKKSPYDDYRKL